MKDKRSVDQNGRAHGEWSDYHDNGQLMYSYNYIHGVMHGFQEGYSYDGELVFSGYINMATKVGYWYWYDILKYYLCLI